MIGTLYLSSEICFPNQGPVSDAVVYEQAHADHQADLYWNDAEYTGVSASTCKALLPSLLKLV